MPNGKEGGKSETHNAKICERGEMDTEGQREKQKWKQKSGLDFTGGY